MRFSGIVVAVLFCGACSVQTPQNEAADSAVPPVSVSGWEAQTPKGQPLAGEKGAVVEVTVVVEKIDRASRMVTVRKPDQTLLTVKAGPEVKRLAEIKPGDHVVLTYIQALAYEVRKAGAGETSLPSGTTAAVERNDKSLPPGVSATAVAHRVTTVTAIDKKNATVTIKGENGALVAIPVKRPENLNRVKVGDTVVIDYLESLAVNIEPAQK